MKVEKKDLFITRFWAWMLERFQPVTWLLFFILYAVALLFGRFLGADGPLHIGWLDLVGFVSAWSFFLMLRVFDEHKDYELDCKNHPHRVLQSGLITLGHLKVAGGLAILAQLGGSLLFDRGFGTVTSSWLLVMFWSTLMAKEFFIGSWLEKRLVLYAISHMLVMPMTVFWLAQMGHGQVILPTDIAWLMVVAFFGGASFEVTRKTRGPEEERETVDSYSKVFGPKTAASVVIVMILLLSIGEVMIVRRILGQPAWFWYAPIAAMFVLPLVTLLGFRASPSEKGREKNEAAVSLSMLGGYIVILVALFVERGAQWS